MCSRYSETRDAPRLMSRFRADVDRDLFEPRFNIAPGTSAPVVYLKDGKRWLAGFRFGLAFPSGDLAGPINARAESLWQKPFFARLVKAQRCLVVADSFYEWSGPKGKKRPSRFALKSGEPFAFAGLWDNSRFAIITTTPNALVAPIHDRMPAMLAAGDEDLWLDAGVSESGPLSNVLRPFDVGLMERFDVSTFVNRATAEGPECWSAPQADSQLALF